MSTEMESCQYNREKLIPGT